MPITRTAMADDDGSGTSGTIINNAWKQEFYNQIDAAVDKGGTVDTIDLVDGTHNNVPLNPLKTIHLIRSVATAGINITGFATSGKVGELVFVEGYGSGVTNLFHQHTGSSANNRLSNNVSSGATILGVGNPGYTAGGNAIYLWDVSGTWRLIFHEQGFPVTVAFAAGNYQGQGVFTAAMVKRHDFILRGRTLTMAFRAEAYPTTGGTNLVVGGFPYACNALANGDYYPAMHAWNFMMANTIASGGSTAVQLLMPNFVAFPGGNQYAFFTVDALVD